MHPTRNRKRIRSVSYTHLEKQAKALLQQAGEKARIRIQQVEQERDSTCEALRKEAEKTMDEAAKCIVKKVVGR